MSRKKILLIALLYTIASVLLVCGPMSPANAITRNQKTYCNHHNQFKQSHWSKSYDVPGRWGLTHGTVSYDYTYSFCRIPGVAKTWIRGRNIGICFKIGFGGTKVIDSVKTDMLAWNSQTVMNEVNDFVLHLPENMSGGESRCDAKWFKATTWRDRNTLPRHRENFWFGIEPPWPDQHHETAITFLDPDRDHTIRIPTRAVAGVS